MLIKAPKMDKSNINTVKHKEIENKEYSIEIGGTIYKINKKITVYIKNVKES